MENLDVSCVVGILMENLLTNKDFRAEVETKYLLLRRYRQSVSPLIALVLLIFSMIACASIEEGVLSSSAFEFTLAGEASHVWTVEVDPSRTYQVIVQRTNSQQPIRQIDILIQYVVEDTVNFIQNEEYYTQDTAFMTFVAPEAETVQVMISSTIGETGADMGEFTVQLLTNEDDFLLAESP